MSKKENAGPKKKRAKRGTDKILPGLLEQAEKKELTAASA
jgi:hypothetical protein